MSKFLDYTGLESLWAKIKALIPTNNNQLTNGAGYINNEYMGYYYSTDSALYIPKGFYFTQGSSSYTYWVPFIIKGTDYTLIKNTAYLREIGSTTNIIRLGSVKLDNGSYGK